MRRGLCRIDECPVETLEERWSFRAAAASCESCNSNSLDFSTGIDCWWCSSGGVGKEAEVDAGWFGGYVKPANLKADRRDRRLARNQNGKRQAVIIIRERGGNSVPAVFSSESAALSFVKARITKGTVLHADALPSWDDLHANFEMKRIDHSKAYSFDGACTNMAEEYFSRLRRAEAGHHHHIAGQYLLRYAQEASWREDNRRVANGDQLRRVAKRATMKATSPDFVGYWQRRKAA